MLKFELFIVKLFTFLFDFIFTMLYIEFLTRVILSVNVILPAEMPARRFGRGDDSSTITRNFFQIL